MTTKKTRSPMKNPTKKQVTDRLNHFENAVKDLYNTVHGDVSNPLAAKLADVINTAPSLAVTVNAPPADASEDLAEGEELVEVEIVVGEEATE